METMDISKYWKPFVATYLGLGIIIYLYSWLVGKDSIFEITKLMITVGIGVSIIGIVMLGRGNVLGGDLRACFKLYDKYPKIGRRSQISKSSARAIMTTNLTFMEDQMKKNRNDESEVIPAT